MMMTTKDRRNGRRIPLVPVFMVTCITALLMSTIIASATVQKDDIQHMNAPKIPNTDSTSGYFQTQNMELEKFDLLGCMSVSPQVVQCAANVYLTYLYPHMPLNVISSCCVVIFKMGEKCLPEFNFPKIESRHFGFLNNLPNQLKQLCELVQSDSSALSTGGRSGGLTVSSKQGDQVFGECLFSKLRSVEQCEKEVLTFFTTLQVQSIGKSCCKAIIDITEGCWSSAFPFNPFFPSLLKNYCMPLLAFPPSP